jgi:hypothetical protein
MFHFPHWSHRNPPKSLISRSEPREVGPARSGSRRHGPLDQPRSDDLCSQSIFDLHNTWRESDMLMACFHPESKTRVQRLHCSKQRITTNAVSQCPFSHATKALLSHPSPPPYTSPELPPDPSPRNQPKPTQNTALNTNPAARNHF